MYHYLFTNDLRISSLDTMLLRTGKCFVTNTVPSASENKSENNNMNTLGFYFNLTHNSKCALACSEGQIRKVVLNFIKKFQFPNPRTQESLQQSVLDNITLAPMRVILQMLYTMNMLYPGSAHLDRDEIKNFIFYNSAIAKTKNPNILETIEQIIEYRKTKVLPPSIETEASNMTWLHESRQIREMVKILTWSGCVIENDNQEIVIHHDSLTDDNKSALFDILTYSNYWTPNVTKSFAETKASYQAYMDLEEYRSGVGTEDAPPVSLEEIVSDAAFLTPAWFKNEAKKYIGVDQEANEKYEQFQALYAPEKLSALTDNELLGYIFLGANDHSMCNALEYDSQYTQFGSIAGAVAYNYFLFYSRSEGVWKTAWGEGGQREVSPEEALIIGKQIRDALVCGADIIASSEALTTANDYSVLLDQLNAAIPQFMGKMWCFKYYHMLFPNLLPVFYSEAWQKHILCSLNIVPSDARFIRMGQISTFTNECGISSVVFSKIIIDNLGAPKTFYRIGTGDNGSYFEEWHQNNYVAIGWNGLGDLSEAYQEDADAKAVIIDALKSQWNYDNRLASRKYREINNFYSCVADNTFAVAMAGQKLYAIGVIAGGYFFDEDREYAHCRPVRWLKVFKEGKTLPFESEGKLTTFVELKNAENLCYLYQLLYGNEESPAEEIVADEAIRAVCFCTGYKSDMPRNRILFGAPGTGKSFTLNQEKDSLLADGGEYERVTFHPDYSYANFVGTYKPVPCKDNTGNDAITYSYVPGPFMRTYVKALLNSRTDTPVPYLLVIEEINRANVAAVFGDVFQLLDRGDDEVSEYAIQASEDIKKYLADQLGGQPDDYSEIRIPDNMFIWATMNSADQGVFPMDTAFKRRWDFTYLGIDDSEAGIVGKKVILGKGDHRKVVEWNELRKAINEELLTYKVNEDKLMGPYFISKKMLPEGDAIDPTTFTRIFKNKVIMYLFDDAAKQKRITLFGGCADKDKNQYSKICAAFDTLGVDIFCDSISSKFFDKAPEGDAE